MSVCPASVSHVVGSPFVPRRRSGPAPRRPSRCSRPRQPRQSGARTSRTPREARRSRRRTSRRPDRTTPGTDSACRPAVVPAVVVVEPPESGLEDDPHAARVCVSGQPARRPRHVRARGRLLRPGHPSWTPASRSGARPGISVTAAGCAAAQRVPPACAGSAPSIAAGARRWASLPPDGPLPDRLCPGAACPRTPGPRPRPKDSGGGRGVCAGENRHGPWTGLPHTHGDDRRPRARPGHESRRESVLGVDGLGRVSVSGGPTRQR